MAAAPPAASWRLPTARLFAPQLPAAPWPSSLLAYFQCCRPPPPTRLGTVADSGQQQRAEGRAGDACNSPPSWSKFALVPVGGSGHVVGRPGGSWRILPPEGGLPNWTRPLLPPLLNPGRAEPAQKTQGAQVRARAQVGPRRQGAARASVEGMARHASTSVDSGRRPAVHFERAQQHSLSQASPGMGGHKAGHARCAGREASTHRPGRCCWRRRSTRGGRIHHLRRSCGTPIRRGCPWGQTWHLALRMGGAAWLSRGLSRRQGLTGSRRPASSRQAAGGGRLSPVGQAELVPLQKSGLSQNPSASRQGGPPVL